MQNNHWIDITHVIFTYVGMIKYYCSSSETKEEGLPLWTYEELKTIGDLSCKYANERSPTDIVESLAETLLPLHNVPPERALDINHLFYEPCDNNELLLLLDKYFTVDNCRFALMSKLFKGQEKEELVLIE